MGTPARPPSFPLALAAVVIANVASVFVSVVVVGAVASVSVYALVAAPYGAAAAVAHDGGYVRALVAIAVAVPIVLWFLQAAVARWVILSNGAAASFGRALAAFA